MEAFYTGKKVIFVVKLENTPNKSIPIDVLDVIDFYSYTEYPIEGWVADLDVFWSKYADFVNGS